MLSAARRRIFPLPVRYLAAVFSAATPSAAADPAVLYLVSTCALSPATAARAADSIRLVSPDSTARADAVLDLLRRYGFSEAQISATVGKLPLVLTTDPTKKLQPQLDFLASVGISAPLLPKLISISPILLLRSIQDHLAPLFESLREILGSDARVVSALRAMPFVARCNPKTTLNLALPALRDVHGVLPGNISRLVALQPGVILQGPDRVAEILQAIKNFGVEPNDPMFIHMFAVLSRMKTPTLERKIALYQSLGFDKDAVTLIMRRNPASMAVSEEKIKKMVGFLVGKAGLSVEEIVSYPQVMMRSLESLSRRCAVFALLRKGEKPNGNHRLPVVLVTPVKRFLRVYVEPHQIEIPDVVSAFNGVIPFEGFDVLPGKKSLDLLGQFSEDCAALAMRRPPRSMVLQDYWNKETLNVIKPLQIIVNRNVWALHVISCICEIMICIYVVLIWTDYHIVKLTELVSVPPWYSQIFSATQILTILHFGQISLDDNILSLYIFEVVILFELLLCKIIGFMTCY